MYWERVRPAALCYVTTCRAAIQERIQVRTEAVGIEREEVSPRQYGYVLWTLRLMGSVIHIKGFKRIFKFLFWVSKSDRFLD